MNRARRATGRAWACVPRASGDEPIQLKEWPVVLYVFPAPAGMNRSPGDWRTKNSCVPRASGDEPPRIGMVRRPGACSPRQRG